MADIKISELPVATTVADADILVVNQGGVTKQAARSLVNAPSGVLPVANGGTGVAVSSGASSVVLRDANQNITANSVIEGFSSVAASGTQITLTVASVPSYLVTGSGGQVIQLPNATTLQNGVVYLFNNNQSSGAITVNNNSGTLVASIPSGGFTVVSLLSNATAAGSWERHEQAPSNVTWSTNTLDYPGSITSATWNGNAVAPNRGGTGQSTYTDGQLLIGNTAGGLTKATLTAGANVTITNGNGSISIASTAASATPTDVQTFTSSGTWTKPAGARAVTIQLVGGGGGGGSGRKGLSGTVCGGGGGGGGSAYTERTISADLLGATVSVSVGAGGLGGAGQTTASTNGLIGGIGGNSTFGTWIFAGGGGAGGAGTTAGGAGGGASSKGIFVGGAGATGATTSTAGAGSSSQAGGAGGGGGGGVSTTPAFTNGGLGRNSFGSFINPSDVPGGTTDGASGGNGQSVDANYAQGGNGGGGGAGSINAANSGGNGGNGGNYGGGAGGGGAALDTNASSGTGGIGGAGIVVVTTYF